MVRAMTARRLLLILSACVISPGVATAQAPDEPPTEAPTEAPTEEPPPADMDGVSEDPDAPRPFGAPDPTAPAVPAKQTRTGFPVEEAARPITLPQNMSEIALIPRLSFDPLDAPGTAPEGGVESTFALRARYGITRTVQLGLDYLIGGFYDDPATVGTDKIGFHAGKAVGLDLTVLLQNWVGVRVGVPVYIDPVAVGLVLGAPMRFYLTDKVTIGGMEDVLGFRVRRFLPELYSEQGNAVRAQQVAVRTAQSRGFLRLSGFGIYQHQERLAVIGRFGVTVDDFSTTRTAAGGGRLITFLRAGIQYTPRDYIDIGLSLGFDDLARVRSFGPAAVIALRI
jgi:hypothetical protein